VIKYLVLHGAEAFDQKCIKTGKSAYDFALQNQQEAMKRSSDKNSIENQIIDILINTKKEFNHPKIKGKASARNQSSLGGSKYR